MTKQKGFTLVELIVVIVILGILAATALPRFVDLSGDARGGVIRGVEAAARGANTMIYGRAAANGVANAANSTVSATTTYALSTTFGYATTLNGLSGAMELSPPGDFGITADNMTIFHARAANSATCSVQYAAPAAVNLTPTYSATITGC